MPCSLTDRKKYASTLGKGGRNGAAAYTAKDIPSASSEMPGIHRITLDNTKHNHLSLHRKFTE
jgi:hypothetical protein